MNRRAFIASSAALAAACVSTSRSREPQIIDTHTHFYDPRRPEGVSWPPKEDKVLYRPVLPAELKEIAQPLGVKGTVIVEASPRVEDNAWILDLVATDPFLLGLVGHLKPGTPEFSRDLGRFAENPAFRGIRTGGWNIAVSADKPDFLRDLELLAKRRLSLDVLGGPDQLPAIAQVAGSLPDLDIVINHCAGVQVSGGAPDGKWMAGIRQVAAHPHVCMKISGLAEASGREFNAPKDTEFYRPVLDLLWNEFGPDRLIFGSNWPVSARFADYGTVLGIVQPYFRSKGMEAETKYFQKNAERVYRVRA